MTAKIPSGPAAPPIIGNIRDFGRDPHRFMLSLILKYGDIAHFRVGRIHGYVLAHPDAVQDVLVRKADSFVKADRSRRIMGSMLGNSLLVSIGDYHARQRRLVQPAFHATRIHAYADTMVDYTEKLLSKWDSSAARDIHADMTLLTMEIVSKTLFGGDVNTDAIRAGRAIAFLQTTANRRFTRLLAPPLWIPTPYNRKVAQAGRTINEVVTRFINDRRAQGMPDTGDLLSMLLLSKDEDGQPMSDAEARDEAVTLFSAGHETTSNALTWTWYLLAKNPPVEARLHAELDSVLAGRHPTLDDLKHLPYTQCVIKEALRMYPPAWTLMSRSVLEDVELAGYALPAGGQVMVSPFAMHRNPRFWDEPDTFRPERFAPENEKMQHRYQYIPFGGGAHICIGNMFAMLEAQLVLATIASRYRLQLAADHLVKERAMITLFPDNGLQMVAHARETTRQAAPVQQRAIHADF